ncbi:MAG: sugar-binding domain-containing protein [Flavobacteriaceae bacterium]
MLIKTYLKLIVITCCSVLSVGAQSSISLQGTWHIALDFGNIGISQGFSEKRFESTIKLPSTLDENKLGAKTQGSDYGILTRTHKYIGAAWYSKEIEIPKKWKNQNIILFLERVMWQSEVWVDGKKMDAQDDLNTPHRHHLGKLKPGKHMLSVRVNNDMVYNMGDKGHAYGDYTQIRWNGILGRIELQARPDVRLNNLTTWPNVANNALTLKFKVENSSEKNTAANVSYKITNKQSGKVVFKGEEKIITTSHALNHSKTIVFNEPVKTWDEFNPNLYAVEVVLRQGKTQDKAETTFGFRDLTASNSKILVNNNPVFMRGNLDCVHFPLTGYPSTDVSEWERIFKIYKNHGLNHVRFHSWCPPEAAFIAADKLGIYIQAEIIWIDWWMSVVRPTRPEMTTLGLPKGLGENPSADAYVQASIKKMIEAYGNHPSFAMFCIGNELGNSNFDVMESWVKPYKESDNRRLYSVSTARKIMPLDQYMVTHNIPKVGRTYGLNYQGTDFDWETNYSQAAIPIIAHEVGQFPVYPLWSEIDKYTGVLEARNLKMFKEEARQNGLLKYNEAFQKSSGALQTLLYKAMIEAFYRTPSCAGFQMLSMTDYSGQGEALIGWLDSFWDSKGIVSPQEFSNYGSAVVALARFPKYVLSAGENFQAQLEIANYSFQNLKGNVQWEITNGKGEIVEKDVFSSTVKQGGITKIGTIDFSTKTITQAEKFTLKLNMSEASISNSWNFWVYPEVERPKTDIIETETLTPEIISKLKNGASVLLLANKADNAMYSYPLQFTPLFWSNSFFPGQTNKTLGFSIEAEHPAFANFPTDYHTDWQWHAISNGRAFIVNGQEGLEPIVQPISDFHINDKLASIFECKIGQGKLLVCGHDLSAPSPVSKQLKNSLLRYMGSSGFNPSFSLNESLALRMFEVRQSGENPLPKGFENAYFFLNCGENIKENGTKPWQNSLDNVVFSMDGFEYEAQVNNVWKTETNSGWEGSEIVFSLKTPNGLIGNLCIEFEGLEGALAGKMYIENRDFDLKTDKDNWARLLVMREDTNKGTVTFKAIAPQGKNIKITKIAFVRN